MEKSLKKGIFLCFEGPEGSGKSTHAYRLARDLEEQGHDVVHTFEPGSTIAGDKMRCLLLNDETVDLFPEAELLLFEADRAQHVREIIAPALKSGKIVITDRFSLATMAYQGHGLGLDTEMITAIDQFATGALSPDMTIVLDVDVETGLERAGGIENADKLERRRKDFHVRVRKAYLNFASLHPDRVKVISVSENIDNTYEKIKAIVDEALVGHKRTG